MGDTVTPKPQVCAAIGWELEFWK